MCARLSQAVFVRSFEQPAHRVRAVGQSDEQTMCHLS